MAYTTQSKILIMNTGKFESCRLALDNELILLNIFKFLNVQDLKNARSVSHLWRDISCTYIQKKAIVKLNENIHSTGSVLEKFLKTFATVPSTRILFRNYKMSLWNLDEFTDTLIAFWEKFGKSMESLELSWVRMIGVEMVRDIFFKNTPNLRRLCIKDCSFYEYQDETMSTLRPFFAIAKLDEDLRFVNPNMTSFEFHGGETHNHFPLGWEEIFLTFPNLKNLKFYNLTPLETSTVLEVAQSFRKKHRESLKLENLNIFNGDYAAAEIPNNVMDQFLSLKFPLNELSIDIGAHCNDKTIAKLFEQHRNVEKLIIYRGPLGTPMINFPFQITFPNLKYLEMTETVADSMNFVQFMPNLMTLALCEPPEVEPPFLPSEIVQKTDIDFAKLQLPVNLVNLRIDYDICCGDVRKLVHWFPNVKNARIYLENESFRMVCAQWPQLEELDVLGDKLTSEGITGLKFKVVEGSTCKTYDHMNILCLKNLRKFIMKNYNLSTNLDDMCVEEGFLKMKHLNHLELCTINITEVGWGKLFLAKHIKTLIPLDGRWQSECEKFKKLSSTSK